MLSNEDSGTLTVQCVLSNEDKGALTVKSELSTEDSRDTNGSAITLQIQFRARYLLKKNNNMVINGSACYM